MLEYDCKQQLQKLNKLWNDDGLYYPGCLSVNLDAKDVQRVRQNEYWFRPNQEGKLMSLCCSSFEKKMCFLVDTNLNCFLLPGRSSRKLLKGTVLNGILYQDSFFITDSPLVGGVNLSGNRFSERIQMISNHINNLFIEKLSITMVPYECNKNIEHFLDHYATQGFTCIPEHNPLQPGTNVNMFTYSHSNEIFLNFRVNNMGSMYLLSKSQYTKTRNKLQVIPEYVKDSQEITIIKCKLINHEAKIWEAIEKINVSEPDTTYMQRKIMEQSKQTIQLRDLTSCC